MTTGGTAHSTTVTGLINGGSYSYFVRCQDVAGNANTNDFTISFSVAQPATAGLVAAYGFNEGSGSSVSDASGNGRTGAISGATWSTQGKFGNALSFDGVNDWVTVDAPPLDLTGMTLEAWVFPTTSNGVRDIIIKEGSNVDSTISTRAMGMAGPNRTSLSAVIIAPQKVRRWPPTCGHMWLAPTTVQPCVYSSTACKRRAWRSAVRLPLPMGRCA